MEIAVSYILYLSILYVFLIFRSWRVELVGWELFNAQLLGLDPCPPSVFCLCRTGCCSRCSCRQCCCRLVTSAVDKRLLCTVQPILNVLCYPFQDSSLPVPHAPNHWPAPHTACTAWRIFRRHCPAVGTIFVSHNLLHFLARANNKKITYTRDRRSRV